jgi:CheY-like chemotaxis protein
LLRIVRAHPLCTKTPLVVITSSESPRDREWTSAHGISHYFRKPSEYDASMQLGAVVRDLT